MIRLGSSTQGHHRSGFATYAPWFALWVGYLLLASPHLTAQSTEINAEKVRQLVRQLEANTASERDTAEKSLRELGPGVLALLPPINARTGGELKQRILRIREHLEAQQVTRSAGGTRVTLMGKMTLSAAFAAIEEQTGNSIVDYRARFNQESDNTEIELELEDVPFWEAFDQLLDEAGLTVNNFVGEARKLAVVAAGDSALPRFRRGVYSGLFRIEPTALVAEKNLVDANGDALRMQMEIVWEPRVVPVLIRQDLEDFEITADNGDSLTLGQTGTLELPIDPGVANKEIRLPIDLPDRGVQEIESLKGRFTALIPGGTVAFEFKNLDKARNAQQRKGGLTVKLDQVRRNGGVQQISVRLRLDQASESLQSHLDWVENNVAKLIDENGKEADPPGLEQYLERENEVGYSYQFVVDGDDLKGWTFVYETPAGIAEIPVEYELKNIPLP